MTILATGDIHGEHSIRKLASRKMACVLSELDKEFTKDDYLIVTGDFGLIWDCKQSNRERWWLNWLDEKPWTTLFVDGNHENHDRLDNWETCMWNGGKVHKITDSVIHLMRGQVYNLQGKKFFTMGGAASHDIEYRVPGVSWWEREIPSKEEMDEAVRNLEKNNWEVDYVVTHDAPTFIANALIYTHDRSTDEFTDWMASISRHLKFKNWYFGHHHQDWVFEVDDSNYIVLYHQIRIVEE